MRRGFTLLEVVVASMLGSIVLLGAIGVMGFMRDSDRRLSERFTDTADLAIVHAAVRRAMQTMVAAPTPPNIHQSNAAASVNETADQRAQRLREEAMRLGRDTEEKKKRPRFILESQVRGNSGPDAPRRLEVVLLDQPTPDPSPTAATIRGAFEVAPEVDGLALMWVPIKPPGRPVKLAGGIETITWEALAREQTDNRFARKSGAWKDSFAALYTGDFPKAIRLGLVTRRGASVEWLFEPAVTTGGEP